MPEKTKRRFRLLRVPFKKDARGRPRNYAQMFHVKHWPTPALSLRHRLRLSIARTHRSCWGIARETNACRGRNALVPAVSAPSV